MEELDLNPSAVATDAGLGRSAVRDILSGKARNPGHLTLVTIAEVLQCSVGYLTGEIDTLYAPDNPRSWFALDRPRWHGQAFLEAGVFRKSWNDLSPGELTPGPSTYRPIELGFEAGRFRSATGRFPGKDLVPFEMGDASMDALKILRGDVLIAPLPGDEQIVLGQSEIIVSLFSPSDVEGHELSARIVSESQGSVSLHCSSEGRNYRPIKLLSTGTDTGRPNEYDAEGGTVRIVGRVVNLSRDYR